MKRNDLVAEDILSGSKSLWHSNRPCEVGADHLDSRPLAVLVASGVDLGPLEVLLGDRGKLTSVGCNVCDNRPDVGFRPCSPVELDSATSGNLSQAVGRAVGAGRLVADDVGGAKSIWLYETVVEVLRRPTNVLRDWGIVLLCVVPVELVAIEELPVDGDAANGTVGGGGGGQSRDGAEGGDCLVHVDG